MRYTRRYPSLDGKDPQRRLAADAGAGAGGGDGNLVRARRRDRRGDVDVERFVEASRHADDRAAVHLAYDLSAEHRQPFVKLAQALDGAPGNHRVVVRRSRCSAGRPSAWRRRDRARREACRRTPRAQPIDRSRQEPDPSAANYPQTTQRRWPHRERLCRNPTWILLEPEKGVGRVLRWCEDPPDPFLPLRITAIR